MGQETMLLTYGQAAQLLNIKERTLKTLVYRGEIPSVKLGSLRRIPRSALEERIAQAVRDGEALRAGGR